MERGEYIMRLALPGERLVHGVLDWVRRIWRDTLNQPDPGDLAETLKRIVSVPFVDYARGDGVTVGPGQEIEWTPVLVSDANPWVDGYRGLWGLDTGDRLAGERAPAGPKYTRVGTVRQSWNDPLGFVGLAAAADTGERAERHGGAHRGAAHRARRRRRPRQRRLRPSSRSWASRCAGSRR